MPIQKNFILIHKFHELMFHKYLSFYYLFLFNTSLNHELIFLSFLIFSILNFFLLTNGFMFKNPLKLVLIFNSIHIMKLSLIKLVYS